MHPTYVSDRPGDCPICNMKLVPIKDDAPPAKGMKPASDEKTGHIQPGQFYCPMDTHVVSNAPGLCPECNMKLIQKQKPPEASSAHPQPVPGRVTVQVSPEKRQLIGLTLAEVSRQELSKVVRASAVVEHDETLYTRIAPRFSGWVRQLHVAYTGAPVEKGAPLFTVYSPELFSAENEYLVAWRAVRQAKEGPSPAQSESAEALLESARLRLALLQIGETEVREIEERGKPAAELLFRSPLSGHVIRKTAVEGASFQAGETLFEISDLSRVWIRAYVFEYEMPMMAAGQPARIIFPYLNSRSFDSEVAFVYPHIEPQTRRGTIRLELANPEHLLRPDMWANVEIQVSLGEKLVVPASAVIDTGERFVAFVDGADHHLEPREVKIGARTDDYFEVLGGLKEGEKVAARALFLVDSESQLKSAIASLAEPHSAHN